jgi:hypothetical protein
MFQRKDDASLMTRITYQRQQIEDSFFTFYENLLDEPENSELFFSYHVSENMNNYVNDSRLYHLVEFDLSNDLALFKLQRTEVFTGLGLAAGLLAACQYIFGWVTSIFYPFLMVQFLVTRMFKIDPSKGQPPKKLAKNDNLTSKEREAFVIGARDRIHSRVHLEQGAFNLLGLNLQQCLRRCFTCSHTRYGKIVEQGKRSIYRDLNLLKWLK